MKIWLTFAALAFLCLPTGAYAGHGHGHGRGHGHGHGPGYGHGHGNGGARDCSPGLRHRSAAEVLEAHRAALNAGDWEAVACNYARDAVVISDNGVTHGRDNVVADLQGLAALFGGTFPQVNEEVIVSVLNDRAEMARVLWSIELPCVTISDGADTYIIKNGQIHAQTAHGFPTFTCAP